MDGIGLGLCPVLASVFVVLNPQVLLIESWLLISDVINVFTQLPAVMTLHTN